MHKPNIFASLVFVLLLVSCADVTVDPKPDPDCPKVEPPPAAPPWPSYGTRLQPFWRTYGDGTKVLDAERLWDSQREEACSFVRVEGGPARCLPAFEWNTKPGMFADAACTKPVAIFPACAELPRYVRDDSSQPWQTCEPRPLAELFPLGDPLSVGAPLYDLNNGACASHTTVDELNAALPMLDPVKLEVFVEGSEGP